MPKEETIELRQIKNAVGEITDLPSLNSRVSLTSRMRALITKFFGVPQLIHLYGALGLNKTLTFDSGENEIITLFSDGTYLYAGLLTTPGKIVKIDLTTFTKISTLTLPTSYNRIFSIVSDGTSLYIGLDIINTSIIKINLKTFTITSTLSLGARSNVQSLFSDGTYIYAGTYETNGRIIKISLETFTITSTLTLSDKNVNILWSDGNYLYAGLATTPGKIIKINLSLFTETSVLTFPIGDNDASIIFSDGIYLYAGLDIANSKVIKIDLLSFTIVDTLLIGEDNIQSMFSDGTYLYVGTWTIPGHIIKIDLASFTISSTINFAAGDNRIYALFSDGTYLYAGLEISPGRIVRTYIIPSADLHQRKIDLIQTNALTQANILSDATPFAGADIGTIKSTTNTINQRTITQVSVMEFWSLFDNYFTISTTSANVNFPDVVITGIPTNSTIIRVVAMLNIRNFVNTNVAENYLNGATSIHVKKSTGTWGTDNIAAINFKTLSWDIAAASSQSGYKHEGNIDVKSEVDENATYNLRFNGNCHSLADNIIIYDYGVGLKVYFIPS